MEILGELTIFPAKEQKFEWRIPDFISISEKHFYSPPFSLAGSIWKFCIFPNGTKSSRGYISLFFGKMDSGPPINLEVSFGLKTSNGQQYCERKFTQPALMGGSGGLEVYGNNRFLSRTLLLREKSKLLPSNVLTVLCTLKHLTSREDGNGTTAKCPHCKELVNSKNISPHEKKCVNKPIKCPDCSIVVVLKNWYDHECQLAKDDPCTPGTSIVPHENKLQYDLKELFLNKEDCDVVIKVQRQEFPAHKNILKTRSPVFASTFRSDMKEKATGVVDIEDCDASSFSDFMCFLYCGDVGNVSKENVFSLFTTSDKYQVEDLRSYCMKFMKENLSIDTFCDTITLALQHSETELIKLSTDFFIKNAPKIIVTVKWQTFAAENPTQSNELFVKLLVPENRLSKTSLKKAN